MPSSLSTLRHMTWLLSGLTLLFIIVWQAPAFYSVQGLASYLPLHMFAETFSIIVSMMVFGVAWNVYSTERPGNIVILACALAAVGLIDFAHMLSFKGMPDFITPSGPEKAINLWLSARLIAALALLTVAIRSWQLSYSSRVRHGLLAISLAIAAAAIWLGLAYPQAWPRTFIAGQGLTPFKIGAEYTIVAILLIPAGLFYAQARRPQSYDAAGLFAATVITILSELSFTVYSDVADIFNLLGHVYKIAAYMFVYRAVFVSSVREPFQRLDAELAENRRITKELRTASLYSRSLIEASLDPMVTISTEGKITDLNQATEVATERSRSELIGTDFSDCFAEPDRAREGYRQAFLKGFVSDYPLVLRHRDGHFTSMLYNASIYQNEQGEVLGVFASARDITEHRRAELVRSQLAAIVESSSDAIIGKRPDGIITSWNKGAERVYGYASDEVIGKHITMLAPASLHAEIRDFLDRVSKGGTVANHETERIRKDGVRIYVALTLSPIRDESGEISGISTIARDITERKLDEKALQRMNRELSAISNCNEILMRAENEQALLDDICRVVCDDAGYRMAWVGYPENDEAKTIRPVAWAGVEDGYLSQAAITWADTERGRGPSGIAIRSGESACFQDFSTDPNALPWRESALQRGYRSSISMPLKDQSANTFGILTIYSTEPNAFTADEIRLLEELAGDLAFGIMVLRTRIERRQAEAALRENEEKYRTLIQKIQAAVIVHGADTQILVSNSMAQEILGLTEDQLLGKMAVDPAWHFFHEDGTVATLDEYPVNKVLASHKALRNYILGVHRPNQQNDVWALVNADPVFGKEDELTQIIVTFIDINERMRVEENLQQMNERFSLSTRAARLGVWDWNLQKNELVWDDRMYELYGVKRENFAGAYEAWLQGIHPDDREASDKISKQAQRGEREYDTEFRVVWPDGSVHHLKAYGQFVRDAEGKPLRMTGVNFDITELKQVEEALRESEWRYREIFDNVLDALYLLEVTGDGRFRTIEVNPALEQLSGVPRARSIGKTQEEIIPEEAARAVNAKYRHCVEAGHPIEEEVELDLPSGRRYFHSTLIPARNEKGTVCRIVGISRDVTENRRAEEKIRQLNAELEQRVAARTADLEAANKELEAFSYSVSHDLRTPLRAIDGFSHILLEDYANKLDEEGRRLLNVVRDNTSRMGQLIDDILMFSRAGRLEITFSEIDMEKLAYSVFVELRPVVVGDKLQLEIEHLPPARGDGAMMRQVFVNLISNAIKFSRNNETPRIRVGATVKDGETIYHVKDNGVGFDMRFSDKLFGVFQRLHSVTEFEGTGIGLAIVKRIVTRHGGRVWAEGRIGEGATIYFTLPQAGKS